MKLPNLEQAVVPWIKIVGYLLSDTHRDGRAKARFFKQVGFEAPAASAMADALLRHASENDVARVESSPFGVRYVIEGPMATPAGRTVDIRSVWFVEHDGVSPRFVTAYPLSGRGMRD